MRACLEFLHEGMTSSFEVTRIDRSRLYGSKRRIPVDAGGRECHPAALTRDGMHVLPKGGISRIYLDESRNAVDRSDLRAASTSGPGIEGDPPHSPPPASPTMAANVAEIVLEARPDDVLSCDISRAWALDPITLSPQLDGILSAGAIQRVRLPSGLAKDSADAFLLKGPACFLLLVGEPTGFELIGRSEVDLVPEAEDDDPLADSDVDFDFGTL
jgi:hypothetical protein